MEYEYKLQSIGTYKEWDDIPVHLTSSYSAWGNDHIVAMELAKTLAKLHLRQVRFNQKGNNQYYYVSPE